MRAVLLKMSVRLMLCLDWVHECGSIHLQRDTQNQTINPNDFLAGPIFSQLAFTAILRYFYNKLAKLSTPLHIIE